MFYLRERAMPKSRDRTLNNEFSIDIVRSFEELEQFRAKEEDASPQGAEWEIVQLEERLRETENYLRSKH